MPLRRNFKKPLIPVIPELLGIGTATLTATFMASTLLLPGCLSQSEQAAVSANTNSTPVVNAAKCTATGSPVVNVIFFDSDQLSIGGSGLKCVDDIVLSNPNNNNVLARFDNIQVNRSGTYLTATPFSTIGSIVQLIAGATYNLAVANANAAVVSTIVISTIGGPAQIANGYHNGMVIGNTVGPANSTTGQQGILFSDGAGSPWIGAVNSSGNILLQTGGTPTSPNGILTLMANNTSAGLKGTVGIGVTVPSSAYGLDVRGLIHSQQSTTSGLLNGVGGGIVFSHPLKTNAYNGAPPQTQDWAIYNTTSPLSNGLEFWSSDYAGTPGTNSPLLTLADAGNVGIGTRTPGALLDVGNGAGLRTLRINGANSGVGTGAVLVFGNSGTTIGKIGNYSAINSSAYSNVMTVNGSSGLTFSTSLGAGVVATFQDSTATSTVKVTTDVAIGGVGITATTGATTWYFINKGGSALITTGGTTPEMTLSQTTGNMLIAGVLTQFSDRRLKENFSEISEPLEKLKKLHGVYFSWKDPKRKESGRQIGLIAQDVQAQFPELVLEREYNGSDPTLKSVLSVDYGKLSSVTVEAIKELDGKIKRLEQENSQLRNQNQGMKTYLCEKDPKAKFCSD